MGEIADMMLDGTICEGCGDFMGDECGFARLCAGCAQERRSAGRVVRSTGLGGFQDVTPINRHDALVKQAKRKVVCPTCKKKVKAVGLNDHIRDVHSGSKSGITVLDKDLK